jgi:hypothetical protein
MHPDPILHSSKRWDMYSGTDMVLLERLLRCRNDLHWLRIRGPLITVWLASSKSSISPQPPKMPSA